MSKLESKRRSYDLDKMKENNMWVDKEEHHAIQRFESFQISKDLNIILSQPQSESRFLKLSNKLKNINFGVRTKLWTLQIRGTKHKVTVVVHCFNWSLRHVEGNGPDLKIYVLGPFWSQFLKDINRPLFY